MGAVEVRGLREFRAGMRFVDSSAQKEMRGIHREIAVRVRDRSRSNASAGSRLERRAAAGIGASASVNRAQVTARNSARVPMATSTFWGALKRTGWYARPRYDGSTRQHPVWVGSSWEAARAGEGPYILNETLRDELPEIERILLDRYTDLYDRAFPQR